MLRKWKSPVRAPEEDSHVKYQRDRSRVVQAFGGRYIYQAPHPWLFARTKRYLVTEAQKSQLMTILPARRPRLRIALVAGGVSAWAAAAGLIAWALSPHDNPTATDALAITALVLIPLYLACVAALHWQLRRIRPIVAEAPRTEERITRREMRKAMTGAMSVRKSLLLAATWAFICATQVAILVERSWHHPALFSNVQSYFNTVTAVLGALLCLYFLAVAIRKVDSRGLAS
jgi:hypothetical protein